MGLDFEITDEEQSANGDFDWLLGKYVNLEKLLMERNQEIAKLRTQLADAGCKCDKDCKCRAFDSRTGYRKTGYRKTGSIENP